MEVTQRDGRDPGTAALLLAEVGPGARRWREPVLVALMGLPGAGKTGTAEYLGARLPLVVLSTDAVRLRYGLPSGPATHAVMRPVAARLLADGAAVLLDSIHLGRAHRDGWRALAHAHGARFELVHVRARPSVAAARLGARRRDPGGTADAGKFVLTQEHARRIAALLEEPGPEEAAWIIDTSDGAPGGTAAPLERHLRALLG